MRINTTNIYQIYDTLSVVNQPEVSLDANLTQYLDLKQYLKYYICDAINTSQTKFCL